MLAVALSACTLVTPEAINGKFGPLDAVSSDTSGTVDTAIPHDSTLPTDSDSDEDTAPNDGDDDGYTLADGDCDDDDADVHPAAEEICGDGVDNNCDGGAGGCTVKDTPLESGIQYTGESANDLAGWAVGGAGDVNDDGYDDALVGAYANSARASMAGRAYLVLGSRSPESQSLSVALRFDGDATYQQSAYSLGGAGDVNADGFADFLVGAPGDSTGGTYAGAVFVVLGSDSPATSDLSGMIEIIGAAPGDALGTVGPGAGDVDGDGFDDVVSGAPRNGDGGSNAGAVYVLLGSERPTGTSVATAIQLRGRAGESTGKAVALCGDIDGDGRSDVLVGAPWNSDTMTEAGAAYLVLDTGSSADLATSGLQLWGEAAYDNAGGAVAGAGDVDADGYDDFLVGAISSDAGGTNAGAAYLLFGSADPGSASLSASNRFTGSATGDNAGASVAGVGDTNSDGFADFAVGATNADGSGGDSGAAYLVLGSSTPTGTTLTDHARLGGATSSDRAGASVAGPGDVNGDGQDDILVGAPNNDDGDSDAGAAYLILGTGL